MDRAARRRVRDERGVTLLEMVLVMMLVSTIILSLAAGLLTSTVAARRVNDAQRLSLGLTAFSESMRDLPYLAGAAGCTPESDAAMYLQRYHQLDADKKAATDGMVLQIVEIKYWKGNRGNVQLPPVPASDQWTGNCTDKGGAQKLRLRVKLEGDPATAFAEIVKRNPGILSS